MNIILTANDGGLVAGLIFGLLFLAISAVATKKIIVEAIRPSKLQEKTKTILFIPLGLIFF